MVGENDLSDNKADAKEKQTPKQKQPQQEKKPTPQFTDLNNIDDVAKPSTAKPTPKPAPELPVSKPEPERTPTPERTPQPTPKPEPELAPLKPAEPKQKITTPPKQDIFHNLMHSIFSKDKTKGPAPETSILEKSSLLAKTELASKISPIKNFFSSYYSKFKKRDLISIGLDIGTSAIKSATLLYERNVPQLIALEVEEIEHENFESGSRHEVIKEYLRRLQNRHFLKGKMFVSMSLPKLITELMYFPVMPDAELDKALRWEANEKLLVDEENYIIDYISLGEVSVAQQVQKEVLLFAVPKKDVLDNYRMLTSLGLRPQAIRPNFLATFKAFESRGLWRDEEVVGFLDIGAGASQFSIIVRGYLRFNRMLKVSGDSTTRSIADYLQISYEEAERSKRELGMSKMVLEEDRKDDSVAAQPRVRIAHAIGLHLDQLIAEVQHSFNYYSLEVSSVPINKMDRLIITGGGASLKGICDFFKSRINIPVEVANPFTYIDSKVRGITSTQIAESGPRFATVIGLAEKV